MHSATVDGISYPLPHVLPADYVPSMADLEALGWEPGYVEPPPPPAVVDFWREGIPTWSTLPAPGSGPAPPTGGGGGDPYGPGGFDDPFGRFMFATAGALGQWGVEGAAPAVAGAAGATYDAAATAAAGVVPAITGAAGWFEDMSKLMLLGLAAIAVITVAK